MSHESTPKPKKIHYTPISSEFASNLISFSTLSSVRQRLLERKPSWKRPDWRRLVHDWPEPEQLLARINALRKPRPRVHRGRHHRLRRRYLMVVKQLATIKPQILSFLLTSTTTNWSPTHTYTQTHVGIDLFSKN